MRHPVYGLGAPERGWVPAPRYALRRRRVLALVDGLPRGRVLEVGCGSGALLHDLADRGFSCQAVETSESAFELASWLSRDRPGVEIHREPRPDWEGAFDLLLAFEVLEHIEDDEAALEQWRSWLRPEGRIMLSVPAHMARWTASDIWAGHFRRYEREGLLGLLDRHGFVMEHHECYGFPLSNLTERVRAWRQGGTAPPPDLAANTARSGTERDLETRLYPLQTSWPGVKLFQACCWLQDRVLDRELGTGYLVLARRR